MEEMKEILKKYRLECDYTQEEIARIINKTPQTYSRYETGTLKPDIDTLIKLADQYKVPLDYLVGRVNNFDELAKMIIPGYALGAQIGDTINRKRATKRYKKAKDKKENPSANAEGEE